MTTRRAGSLQVTRRTVMATGLAAVVPLPALARLPGAPAPLTAFIQAEMARQHVPGLNVVALKNGEIVWAQSFGLADIATERPLQLADVSIIASISKTIATTHVMALVEAGKLSLDEDITRYLGFTVRNPHHPQAIITLRHIVTHTSGLIDAAGPYADSYHAGELDGGTERFIRTWYEVGGSGYAADSGFFTPDAPGKSYVYANTPWGLVSIILSRATGGEYADTVRRHILRPVGMKEATFRYGEIPASRYLTPYSWWENGRHSRDMPVPDRFVAATDDSWKKPGFTGHLPCTPFYSYPSYADGGLRSSALELALYAKAWLGMTWGGRDGVLKSATARSVLTSQTSGSVILPDKIPAQGLSFYGFPPVAGRPAWGHGGFEHGINTRLKFLPGEGVGVVTVANLDHYDDDIVADEVLARLLA